MKNTSTKPPLAQSSKDTHTLNNTIPPNKSKDVHEPGLFQSSYSQLNHYKRYFYITKNKISYSLIEPHNFFPNYQTAVADSMHFHFTFTPHLQHLQSGLHVESSQTTVIGFLGNIVNLAKPLTSLTEEPHRRCMTIF